MMYTTLIEPEELLNYIERSDWRIVDCRFSLQDTELGRKLYTRDHLPGAVYAHLDQDLSSPPVPGKTGRHPLPEVNKLVQRLESLGISDDTQVVVYDDRGGAIADRLWWLLRWIGHEAVCVLNGGYPRWKKAGYPLTNTANEYPKGSVTPSVQPDLHVTTEFVEEILGNPDYLLVDARARDRYLGINEPIDPVAGHIPGAVSLPFEENLDAEGVYLPSEQLLAKYQKILENHDPDKIIVYCGSGVTSIHHIVGMMHVGLKPPRLYVGSWSEWICDPTRPIVTRHEID